MIDFTFFILLIFSILAVLNDNMLLAAGLFAIAILVTKEKMFIILGLAVAGYFLTTKYLEIDVPSWMLMIILAIVMVLILRNMKDEPQYPQGYYQ